MTQLTDGRITASITMMEWIGTGSAADWNNDFFNTGCLPLVWVDALNDSAYKVEDVNYCIDQANDWQNYTGDFFDPETQDWSIKNGIKRDVNVNILV